MDELPNEHAVKDEILCVRLPHGWKFALQKYVYRGEKYDDISDLVRDLIIKEFDQTDEKLRHSIGNLRTELRQATDAVKEVTYAFRGAQAGQSAYCDYGATEALERLTEIATKIEYLADDEIARSLEREQITANVSNIDESCEGG